MKATGILLLVLLLFSTALTFAQENQNEYRTIFNSSGDKKSSHGGYGAFSMGYSNINGSGAMLWGLKGAWVIDHHIALGMAGYGFVNNLGNNNNLLDLYLGGGYGGFYFEPIIAPNSPVHVSFPILIGGGGVAAFSADYWDIGYDDYFYDIFFVFEPGVEVEFNLASFFKLAVGTSYRFTNGVILNYPLNGGISENALNAFNFYVIFKFGKF